MEPSENWLRRMESWRGTPFAWKRWIRPHADWSHDHCDCCSAHITDVRDHDPFDKPGVMEGGYYRHAYYAERDGIYVWVCRRCFKLAQKAVGLTRARRAV